MSFHQQQWLPNIFCSLFAHGPGMRFYLKTEVFDEVDRVSPDASSFSLKSFGLLSLKASQKVQKGCCAASFTLKKEVCWNSVSSCLEVGKKPVGSCTLQCVWKIASICLHPPPFSRFQETFLLWQSLPCFHQPSWGLKLTIRWWWKHRHPCYKKTNHDSATGLWNKSLKLKSSQNENQKTYANFPAKKNEGGFFSLAVPSVTS